MRLVLFQPDIPQNVGAAMRLAACFATPLDLIEPCGFALTDRGLRRAALDYQADAEVARHAGWSAYRAAPEAAKGRLVLFTTKAATSIWTHRFAPDDRLLFGRESAGVPDNVHAAADVRLIVPIAPSARSLNVVCAAAVALAEADRQRRARDEERSASCEVARAGANMRCSGDPSAWETT